ncbi:DUF4412 domain-containing protein [Geofilum rhodophaeum]|uniref:DUF4412 domain-containing protein n=1 Tax=Geofilum rhodophaeum TaxID=1965019 RepID=UPI000B523309|nr:DUF4412 domain-containing protein [Geofilum rhodophaeum]
MKRKWINSLTLALIFSPSFSLQAQSLMDRMAKKAAEKLEQKTEERIERKIDEGIERGLDATEDAVKEATPPDTPTATPKATTEAAAEQRADQQHARMQNMLSKMGVSGEPVRFNDSYTFNTSIHMHIKTLKKNGKVNSEGDIISYLNEDQNCSAFEFVSGNLEMKDAPQNKGLFIMDQKNQSTLLLTNENDEKTGLAYGMSGLENMTYEEDSVANEEEVWQHPNLQKTGRTKTIAGYPCEEYTYADEESKGAFWLTTSLKGLQNKALPAQFGWSQLFMGNTKGFIMASESTDLKTGETSTMEITEINTSRSTTFNIGEYAITNLGSMQLGGE